MYRIDRNNFFAEQKDATVYTPEPVSRFLFEIVHEKIDPDGLVLDPCVGTGSLLGPFNDAGFRTLGIDIEDQGYPSTMVKDFLSLKAGQIETPALAIVNPPFNVDRKMQERAKKMLGRRPLLPEVWLNRIVELWGKKVPTILFAPYGMRLNQSVTSGRWQRFVNGTYPEIVSIVALPKDVYDKVMFHSEVLIFNINGLKGHYFFGP